MGNLGCFPLGKPAATESLYPAYDALWVFQCFHTSPNSDMDYRIFNVRTDFNACNCTRRCTDTVRESALKVDSGRNKSPCRTEKSNRSQPRAGPTLYQLSYFPTTVTCYMGSELDLYLRSEDLCSVLPLFDPCGWLGVKHLESANHWALSIMNQPVTGR